MARPNKQGPAAMAWLRANVQRGQHYRAGELLRAARQAGHAERTIQAAAERLGVERRYRGMRGVMVWSWTLPDEGEEDEPEHAA
jgi:hypothetical protein